MQIDEVVTVLSPEHRAILTQAARRPRRDETDKRATGEASVPASA